MPRFQAKDSKIQIKSKKPITS